MNRPPQMTRRFWYLVFTLLLPCFNRSGRLCPPRRRAPALMVASIRIRRSGKGRHDGKPWDLVILTTFSLFLERDDLSQVAYSRATGRSRCVTTGRSRISNLTLRVLSCPAFSRRKYPRSRVQSVVRAVGWLVVGSCSISCAFRRSGKDQLASHRADCTG